MRRANFFHLSIKSIVVINKTKHQNNNLLEVTTYFWFTLDVLMISKEYVLVKLCGFGRQKSNNYLIITCVVMKISHN